jgi:hypothetical protein
VTHTFNAGFCINIIDGSAFGDGVGRAFRQACSAGNAVIGDFHCHVSFTPVKVILGSFQKSWGREEVKLCFARFHSLTPVFEKTLFYYYSLFKITYASNTVN